MSAFDPKLPLGFDVIALDEACANSVAVRSLVPLALFGVLGACDPTITRADQSNFTLRAGPKGVQPFVAALERGFGSSAQAQKVYFPESDPSEMFEVRGRDVTVIINPVPDDRCNPNAPMHMTYKQGEYRIDLVYRTSSADKREQARRTLAEAARTAGQALTPFKEC